jgi:hypothetical protein
MWKSFSQQKLEAEIRQALTKPETNKFGGSEISSVWDPISKLLGSYHLFSYAKIRHWSRRPGR